MLTQRSHAHAAENRWSLTALQTTSTATRLQVTLDDFGACARATEAARQGVTAEELAVRGGDVLPRRSRQRAAHPKSPAAPPFLTGQDG